MRRLFSLFLEPIELFKAKILGYTGMLEGEAFLKGSYVGAVVYVYANQKLIIHTRTPFSLKLKPGRYTVRVTYMSYVVEKDVEIKEGETVRKEFKFPGGTLECKAYEGVREVNATVEVVNVESGEVVAKRVTPFIIYLEAGKYTLRAIYTPSKEG